MDTWTSIGWGSAVVPNMDKSGKDVRKGVANYKFFAYVFYGWPQIMTVHNQLIITVHKTKQQPSNAALSRFSAAHHNNV